MDERRDRERTRMERCARCYPDMKDGKVVWTCRSDDMARSVTEEDCAECPKYKSRYIEYPITVNEIVSKEHYDLYHERVGRFCEVRLASDENGTTRLGVFLGSLPYAMSNSYDRKTGVLTNFMVSNPAIYVPSLKRIVWGMESWWRCLEPGEEPAGIADADIDGTWYVRMAKMMFGGENTCAPEDSGV